MATASQHKAKAEHNERFVASLGLASTPFRDWVMTGVFYAALHYIRAYAASKTLTNISSYGEVDRLFERFAPLKPLYAHYRFLKDGSREARYEMRTLTVIHIQEMIRDDFAPIKSFVLGQVP